MMKKSILLIFLFLIVSCDNSKKESEKWKAEILKTEADFAEMARNEGIPEAFIAYAANDVAILRDNILILGKEALTESYNKSSYKNVELDWTPDYVDVSASGDLGYTYGKYVYKVTDSLGKQQVHEGIFHTVWKRQPDGGWKFVWD